jgi:hypothetical protein
MVAAVNNPARAKEKTAIEKQQLLAEKHPAKQS